MVAEDAPADFVDMITCLREEACDFVVVGAHAIAAHGAPRATGDLDILVRPDPENARRVYRAVARFGAPVAAHGVQPEDFASRGTIYQIGLPPHRIDVLTAIDGVTFDEAAADVVVGHLGDVEVPCIGLAALLRNKIAAGRPKDLGDVETLRELIARRGG